MENRENEAKRSILVPLLWVAGLLIYIVLTMVWQAQDAAREKERLIESERMEKLATQCMALPDERRQAECVRPAEQCLGLPKEQRKECIVTLQRKMPKG
jgi:hypothetical protein